MVFFDHLARPSSLRNDEESCVTSDGPTRERFRKIDRATWRDSWREVGSLRFAFRERSEDMPPGLGPDWGGEIGHGKNCSQGS